MKFCRLKNNDNEFLKQKFAVILLNDQGIDALKVFFL